MRKINTCLNKQLSALCQKSIELEDLAQKIREYLPPHLTHNCQVASFNNGELVITSDDPSIASQLRYMLPELRDKLRKEGKLYQLMSIKLSLLTPNPMIKSTAKSVSMQLSSQAKASIIQESEHCSYEPLKKALLHLATRVR